MEPRLSEFVFGHRDDAFGDFLEALEGGELRLFALGHQTKDRLQTGRGRQQWNPRWVLGRGPFRAFALLGSPLSRRKTWRAKSYDSPH